jgi:hypothetical protein
VGAHVLVKRYLTCKYPEYYDALSDASKTTLKYQVRDQHACPPFQAHTHAARLCRAGRSPPPKLQRLSRIPCLRPSARCASFPLPRTPTHPCMRD